MEKRYSEKMTKQKKSERGFKEAMHDQQHLVLHKYRGERILGNTLDFSKSNFSRIFEIIVSAMWGRSSVTLMRIGF